MNGGLYAGAKPVLWSVVEKTALADAEVEYHDHKSPTIWVRFPVVEGPDELKGASVVIWTTTPWTIPGNRAVAAGPEFDYIGVQVKAVGENSRAKVGEKLLLAKELFGAFAEKCEITEHEVFWQGLGADLLGLRCDHPLASAGYDAGAPVLNGDFVTTEAGTGFVHIAPGHGADDFELGKANGLEIPQTVDADGSFFAHVPLFAGSLVYTSEGKEGDANGKVIGALIESGALIAKGSLRHSYPHSWRSKAPLIFRNTPQWFISMESNDLQKNAVKAIEETNFVPASGRNRLMSMVADRPDWCVSRQRLWGVPLPIFVEKATGEPLRDAAVVERVAQAFEEEGGDAWFNSDPSRFLGNDYNPEDYEQITDVVEVWFDSGSTHSFVLEARPELQWPASLYLEGSDQHRGWFQSSLLESAGTRGRAPYDAVLTHGFLLDEQGRKMSKSLGNGVEPQDVMNESGADIIRLWVVASDYTADLRVGPKILRYQVDAYRRLRNTLRFMLGALDGFSEDEKLPVEQMPELERWVLHRLQELDGIVRKGCAEFDFHNIYKNLHNFCAVDLSAFYFDIRKDALYCDRMDSLRRRACRTVIDQTFNCLVTWLAPILCFTVEEAWMARGANAEDSVHLQLFPDVPAAWRDEALAQKWAAVREVRRVVTGALELERAAKRIGSSLQARPVVTIARPELMEAVRDLDMMDIAITSDLSLVEGTPPEGAFTLEEVAGVGVTIEMAEGQKCQRCWKVLPEVGSFEGAPGTCGRCADAIQQLGAAAQ